MTDYKARREVTKKNLTTLGGIVKALMIQYPEFRSIKGKYRNRLIRYIWSEYNEDIPSESITKLHRKVLADNPELDTEDNIDNRANAETAYRDWTKECESL